MSELQPTRGSNDLAEMVELLLDKGVVINADIAVSVGDTELLNVHIRAAVASFETAARYGLEFPAGTDTDRIDAIAGRTGAGAAGGDPLDTDAVEGVAASDTGAKTDEDENAGEAERSAGDAPVAEEPAEVASDDE